MADILLDAEVRLGEILEAIEPKYNGSVVSSGDGTHQVPKQEKSLPPDISKKQSHQAQTLSKIARPSKQNCNLQYLQIPPPHTRG